MAVTFPTTLDSFTDRNSGDTISEDHMNDVQDAIEQLEAKVGINDSAVTSSLDYLIDNIPANAVDSDAYVDGSIDLIHMSANSVDSGQYVDGSIDSEHLAADIIGPSKCSNGTLLAACQGSYIITPGTSFAGVAYFYIRCPTGPTTLHGYCRIKATSGTYCKFTVTGVGDSSLIATTASSSYNWQDMGTLDMSSATPGNYYELILNLRRGAAGEGGVQGMSIWWE